MRDATAREILGKQLTDARDLAKITVEQLAQRAKLTVEEVHQLERGEVDSLDTFERASRAMNYRISLSANFTIRH